MKKLGKLNLKAEKMLSHEELVSFRGGSGGSCPNGLRLYQCECHGTAGQWTGCYEDASAAGDAAAYWCVNGTGGGCYPA